MKLQILFGINGRNQSESAPFVFLHFESKYVINYFSHN